MPPAFGSPSNSVTSYPSGARSRATVSDAGPAPMQAIFLPFFFAAGLGRRALKLSSLKSAATRFRRQIATGSGRAWFSSSTLPRRQAGSQGRSQVRPRMPGNTFERQLTR